MRSTTGKFLTKALFWETSSPASREKYPPIYTLKEQAHTAHDGVTYPSAYAIYMDSIDEYDAAQKLLGSTLHWDSLLRCTWFMEGKHLGEQKLTMGLHDWRAHKDRAEKSKAKEQLMSAAEAGNVTAQRTLYGTPPKARGRKSKPVIGGLERDLDSNVKDFLDAQSSG